MSKLFVAFTVVFTLLTMGAKSESCANVASSTPSLEQFATSNISDFKASVVVDMANEQKLQKINRDFAIIYRLKKLNIYYKDPDKLRMENKFALMIINGDSRYYQIPMFGIKRTDHISSDMSQKHSLLDLGVLPASSLTNIESKFLSSETDNGYKIDIFDFNFKGDTDSIYKIWVNTSNNLIEKKEWYGAGNKLKATFLYKSPKEIKPGLWLPTRIEVLNADGSIAAITSYENIQVNGNLSNSLFVIS